MLVASFSLSLADSYSLGSIFVQISKFVSNAYTKCTFLSRAGWEFDFFWFVSQKNLQILKCSCLKNGTNKKLKLHVKQNSLNIYIYCVSENISIFKIKKSSDFNFLNFL